MNITLLFLIAAIFLVMVASTVDSVMAEKNTSDNPRAHKKTKHPMHKKFLDTKICGLQICGK